MNRPGQLLMCLFLLPAGVMVPLYAQRPTVSEAMRKAADDNREERRIDVGTEYQYPEYQYPDSRRGGELYRSDEADGVSGRDGTDQFNVFSFLGEMVGELLRVDDGESDSDSSSGTRPVYAGVTGGGALSGNASFSGAVHTMIYAGVYVNERLRAGFTLGGNFPGLEQGTIIDEGVEGDVTVISAGGHATWFTTPRHTWLGQFFTVGVAWSSLAWEYHNPVYVTNASYRVSGANASGRTVEGDAVAGVELYAGAGVNIVQTEFVQIGLEATPGIIFWDRETAKGFENDTFAPFPYVKFGASATILF